MSKKLIAFRLPERVISKLKNLSELEDISQAVLVERAIELYVLSKLNKDESIYNKKEAVIQKESE